LEIGQKRFMQLSLRAGAGNVGGGLADGGGDAMLQRDLTAELHLEVPVNLQTDLRLELLHLRVDVLQEVGKWVSECSGCRELSQ
jgi:hypothetical protein